MAAPVAEGEDREGWLPHRDDTFVGRLGMVLQRQRNGLTELALQTTADHRNLSGIVHGGVIMTLLDRTVGVNCRAASMGEPMATASLTVNFLQRVRVGERIEFRCHLRRKGRKTWFADAEAWVDDRLVATATGLWLKLG